ncbi:hypothetical protein [Flavobacterium oreochromis]|uniref:Uncharacterized protein n=2 Tax=Flavobacterium TaxID=237 RepID=A0A2D0AHP1_9FLAO|nr:hypothetical protein [Flavobacterium oreochromis]OWP75690.1 hypothetical protein BWK62_11520 [Flavobacterium oreochromis]OWP78329.1 hypothetical protein BWG23_02315 [Flavobacterium oreochromis]POR25288.1 hypothetical protein BWK58_07190 [Flavobacterium columnare]QYS85571.1 hypothetical protein JJC03_10145 [Flavobacterium oreochromis]
MEHVKKDLGEISKTLENPIDHEMTKDSIYKKIVIQNFNFITNSNRSNENIKDIIEKERKDSSI